MPPFGYLPLSRYASDTIVPKEILHVSSRLRAEHLSLEGYLLGKLSDGQRKNVLFSSFSQWGFALAALADTALTFQQIGSTVSCAFWAGETPLHDAGWTTNHKLGRLFRSPTPDDRVKAGMIELGIPEVSMAPPPIKNWRPLEPVEISRPMNRSEIRSLTYRGSAMGRAILQVHPDSNTPISDVHYWPKRWLKLATKSYAFVYDQTRELIERRGITALVVYNGRFLHDGAAIAAATNMGIPVASYDSGGNQTDFDLTTDPTHDWAALQRRMLDLYAAWEPAERESLGSEWFEGRINHTDPQNALFVESQKPGTRISDLPSNRTVVFFSSSGDEIVELGLDWDAFFGGQSEALMLLADQCRQLPGYSLIVRTHPHNRFKPAHDVAEWTADVEEAKPEIHIDQHSPVDSYELMRQADIIVTYGSTTGVEAGFAKKPVIVMGPSAYDLLGCATPVSSVTELRHALELAEPGDWEGAVSYGLMMMRRGFLFSFVERDLEFGYRLGNQPFANSAPILQHVSHLLDRVHRWYLTEG